MAAVKNNRPSDKVMQILYAYANRARIKGFFNDCWIRLFVSLEYYWIHVLNEGEITIDERVFDILSNYIFDVVEEFSEEDLSALTEGEDNILVLEYCCNMFDKDILSNNTAEHSQPEALTNFICKLLDIEDGTSIYMPFSGYCSEIVELKKMDVSCDIEGEELSQFAWAISILRLEANCVYFNNSKISANIRNLDSYKNLLAVDKLFNYVLFTPPFAFKSLDGYDEFDAVRMAIENKLIDGGKLCCILPSSFLYSNSKSVIRLKEYLINNKYLRSIISLPQIFAPITQINTIVLLAEKCEGENIALVDGSSFVTEGLKENGGGRLKAESLYETIAQFDEKYVWVGNYDELKDDHNLSPARYLINKILPTPQQGEVLLPIKSLVDIVPLVRVENRENNRQLLGMAELSNNYLNCNISVNNIPTKRSISSKCIKDNCLLVGYIGGKFKVGSLTENLENFSIELRQEIIPIKLKENISVAITEDFLLRCIMSEYCELQASMYAKGSTIKRISTDDFLNISIIVPSLDEQRRLCKDDTRASLTEADRKLLESFEDFRKDMHMKKHAIGQTLFNLNNWWDALQQARKEGHGIVSDDATTGRIRKVSVSSIYDSLQKTINQLQQQINKFDRGNGLSVKRFALTEFIEDYILRKQSPLFTFSYNPESHRASQTLSEIEYDEMTKNACKTGKIILNIGDPIEYIEFAPDALEIIFDNIVSNACCHGFKDSSDKHYIIKIELKPEENNYVVIISNNGDAIHSQIKPNEVFVYGKTSKMGKGSHEREAHFGIGGYEIQKLMREFGGDAEFISDPESEFPVSYKLTFYITNIENVEL